MKRLLCTIILGLSVMTLFAQDTTKVKKQDILILGYGEGSPVLNFRKMRVTTRPPVLPYPNFSFGIIISRLDLGLTGLTDHNSLTLRTQNSFLSYHAWQSTNAGFDVFQVGERFCDQFKIYLSAGFDWTNLRLRQNITLLPHAPVLTAVPAGTDLSEDRSTSTYLRVPLSFDFRTSPNAKGRRFHFVLGPDAGFLLAASLKQVSAADGTQKSFGTFNYAAFRYGGFLRVGYGKWGVFAKYQFNYLFSDSREQDGLRNFAFGIMLGF